MELCKFCQSDSLTSLEDTSWLQYSSLYGWSVEAWQLSTPPCSPGQSWGSPWSSSPPAWLSSPASSTSTLWPADTTSTISQSVKQSVRHDSTLKSNITFINTEFYKFRNKNLQKVIKKNSSKILMSEQFIICKFHILVGRVFSQSLNRIVHIIFHQVCFTF